MLRIVIGLQNYNGVACGVNFEKSVGQGIPEDWTADHVQVKRLLALFPGTTVETVDAEKPKLTPQPEAELETVKDRAVTEEPETSATSEDAEEAPQAESVEEETEEVSEEVDEVGEPEDEEKKPLSAGDMVLAHYKGEFRKGEVVKVLESGVVRVNIDDDDANYRVLDDDKVSKLDQEAGK